MNTDLVMSGMDAEGFEWKATKKDALDDRVDLLSYGFADGFRGIAVGPLNFKNIWWLEVGVAAARKVARIKLPGGAFTGFLVGNDLLMTNMHAIENEADAAAAIVQFDYRLSMDGTPEDVDEWTCDPDSLKNNKSLDYAVVKLKAKDGAVPGQQRGYFDLRKDAEAEIFEDNRVNIIQYPEGRYQQIVFRNNQVKYLDESVVQYLTETDYGSSGSPVFNDRFQVVALHKKRMLHPKYPYQWYRNQGTRIQAIVDHLGADLP